MGYVPVITGRNPIMDKIYPIGLTEGIAPPAFDGFFSAKLPQFNKDKEYGMFIEMGYEGWSDSLVGMLEIYWDFIPEDSKRYVEFVVKPIKTIDDLNSFTIGWKYNPLTNSLPREVTI